jgi:hypothetical protein
MDNRQYYRFKALLRVVRYLKDNESALSAVTVIAPVEAELKQMTEDIVKAEGIATTDHSGATVHKGDVREALITTTRKVMRAMESLAIDTEDKLLALATGRSRSKMTQMTDSDLYVFCLKIMEIAQPLAAQLEDYNLEEEQIDMIATLAENFYQAGKSAKEVERARKHAHGTVIDLINAAYTLMDKKLDIYVDLFQADNADLVEGYYLARKVGHHGKAALPDNFIGTVVADSPAIFTLRRYGPTKGLLLVNSSSTPLHFQLFDEEEPVGISIALAPWSAFIGVMADLADRGTALHITTASDVPASYRIEIG